MNLRLSRGLAALSAFALLSCTQGSPGASPSPSSGTPTPSPTVSATPSAPATPTPSASATARPSASATARPTASPTRPASQCSIVRGSRAVDDFQNASVAFVDATTGVVAVGKKVFRSTDSGRTWRAVKTLQGNAFDVVAAGCRVLFLLSDGATGTHLDRSDDGGATWRRVVSNGAPFRALDFVTPRVGFALEPFPDEPGGLLWKTYDGGAHWRRIAQPGDAVFSVSAAANGVTLAGVDNGIAKSTDGGATWRLVATTSQRNWRSRVWLGANLRSAWGLLEGFDPANNAYRFYRTDDGASWFTNGTDATQPFGSSPGLISGTGSATLSIAAFDGDGVSTHTTRNGSQTFVRGMVIRPDSEGGDIVYGVSGISWLDASRAVAVVGPDSAGIYRTTDAGRTWRQVAFVEG